MKTQNMWSWTLIFCIVIQTSVSRIIYTEEEEESVALNILGLFEPSPDRSDTQMRAFNESIRNNRQLEPCIYFPRRVDSYTVWRELCSNKSVQVVAVFGPQNPVSDRAVLDQCAKLQIPFIQAAWQPFDPDQEELEEETTENEDDVSFRNVAINFYPDPDELAIAYAKVLEYYNWENFVVLYEDNYGLLRVQKIIAQLSTKYPIVVRRLDPENENYEIYKEISKMQESRVLLDCHVSRIKKFLKVAVTLNMLNAYQHYVLMSMDAGMVEKELSQHLSNFTWLSLTNYDDLKNSQHHLTGRVGRWTKHDVIPPPPVISFPTEALLMDDVATHVGKAVKAAGIEEGTNPCASAEPWEYGAKLQREILETTSSGISGKISFDKYGRRTNFSLYINEIYSKQMRPIGTWESENGEILLTKEIDEVRNNQTTNEKFIVMSRMAEPYFQLNKSCIASDSCDPSDKYIGFSVDLVKHIFEVIAKEEKKNHTYEFIADEKITYGKYNPVEKKWNGLIGKLLDKEADLVVCDLTITEERKKIVDFSVPFMTLGISILFTTDVKVTPDKLSFLHPYTLEMWLYTATAYCVVSVLLFICSRVSPADWENPQPCDKDPAELENIWNFKNCTWLTMGSIMTQGCDILPKAFGSRWVCGMWWFFAMIVCQTYIAQLAASMTTATNNVPIESVEQLAQQSKVLYGAYASGSTLDFFRKSKDKMYLKMYENMMANPGVLVDSNEAGERMVLKQRNKYAFFMESVTIEYKQKRNCNLKKVGGELDSKDYGIAMPANSPFRSMINRAILKLKENNKLNEIKDKWWNKEFGAKTCEDEKDENDVEGDLEIENLIGAFLVLIIGLAICLLITAAEFMNEVRNIVVREQVTHKEVFLKELKASLNFFQLQKPVLRNPSRAPSVASSEKSNRSKRRAEQVQSFLDLEKEPQ